jgi:hypothetical protein
MEYVHNMTEDHVLIRDDQSWHLTCLTIHLTFPFNLSKSYDQPSTIYFSFGACFLPQHSQLSFPCDFVVVVDVCAHCWQQVFWSIFKNLIAKFFSYILDCLPWHCPRC